MGIGKILILKYSFCLILIIFISISFFFLIDCISVCQLANFPNLFYLLFLIDCFLFLTFISSFFIFFIFVHNFLFIIYYSSFFIYHILFIIFYSSFFIHHFLFFLVLRYINGNYIFITFIFYKKYVLNLFLHVIFSY